MHDSKNAISVQNLISTLAAATVYQPRRNDKSQDKANDEVRQENSLRLTQGFWETMAREWLGADALRMNKYLLLVRVVLRNIFVLISNQTLDHSLARRQEKGAGNSSLLDMHLRLLERFPLAPRDRKIPDGLRYHVLDIYVDEIETSLNLVSDTEGSSPEQRQVVERLVVPVEKVSRDGLSKSVRVRAKETLADERVAEWRGTAGGEAVDNLAQAEIPTRGRPAAGDGTTAAADEEEEKEEEWEGFG